MSTCIALDSPMEALAIHGVLTVVNNVWAWIAFLTAAISFWKIKSSHLHLSLHSSPQPQISPAAAAQPNHQQDLPSNSTTTRTDSVTLNRHTAFCTLENRKSGKFSVYYAQDDETKNDKIRGEEEIDVSSNRRNREEGDENLMDSVVESEVRKMSSIRCKRNCGEDGLEVVLKMKTPAEMGWYLYQDLTVLDGNVVRLWN